MSEWKTIDSVPEDKIVMMGFFYDENAKGYEEKEHADCFIQLGKICHGIAYAICGAPANQCVSIWLDVKPTHWMQLPEAPK